MATSIVLDVERREVSSRNANRRLRRANKIPAIVYGEGREPTPLVVSGLTLARALKSESFSSQLIELRLGEISQQVVLRDLQRNPATDHVLHLDFLRVSEDTQITVNIPVHLLNTEKCEGVRLGGGLINQSLIEIEVSCLPAQIPEFVEIDVEHMVVGDVVHLSDLQLPEGVVIPALEQGESDYDIPVIAVQIPRGGLEEEEAEAEGEELDEEEGEDESEEEVDE